MPQMSFLGVTGVPFSGTSLLEVKTYPSSDMSSGVFGDGSSHDCSEMSRDGTSEYDLLSGMMDIRCTGAVDILEDLYG